MLLSKFIMRLQEVEKANGNLPVVIKDESRGFVEVTTITALSEEKYVTGNLFKPVDMSRLIKLS